jgi:hypothetical protein
VEVGSEQQYSDRSEGMTMYRTVYARFLIKAVVVLTALGCFDVRISAAMSHDIPFLPLYSPTGETPADDPDFARKCAIEAQRLASDTHLILHDPVITVNSTFGVVWRADYEVPGGMKNVTNRIMFWKLGDGKLGRFAGLNLGVPPLGNSAIARRKRGSSDRSQ